MPAVWACLVVTMVGASAAGASCPTSCPEPAGWTQPFSFAGLSWERKSGCGGPGPNCWQPANAVVDTDGVHLKLTRASNRWYAAEMRTTQPVPTGSYSVRLVGRPDLLDPNVVLGVFLYDDAAAEAGGACPAELDLESSRFGDAGAGNGNFVTYGADLCGAADLDAFSYTLNGTYSTHRIDWAPGSVSFALLHGHRCAAETPNLLIAERRFDSSRIPAAGGMRLHLNLWAFAGLAPTDRQEVEIVVRDIVTTCNAVASAAPASWPATGPDWNVEVRRDPSGAEAEILFALPGDQHVTLSVVDVSGRRLATLIDADLTAGPHRARWDCGGAASGIYFVRIVAGGRAAARRIIVVH